MCSFLWAFWLFPGLPSQTLLQWAPLDARAAEDQNCCVVWVFCFALFAGFSLLPTPTCLLFPIQQRIPFFFFLVI